MRTEQRHIVRRSTIILEKETRDKKGDHQLLLERLSNLANNELPDLFEDSFGTIVPENETWRLNQLLLEVDINKLSELEETIRLQLPNLIKAAVRKTWSKSENSKLLEPGQPLGSKDILLHYLKTGTLTWNSPHTISIKDIHEVFDKGLVADTTLVKQLRQLFICNEKALERFLLYFEKSHYWQFYIAVRKSFHEKKPSNYADWLHQYEKIQERSTTTTAKGYWQQILNGGALQEILNMPDAPEKSDIEKKSKEIDKEQLETEDQVIYLDHAGLVLLHPFITRFLESQELIRENEVLKPDRASCVLHSLVTGASPVAEWQLVLPKVLLGVSIDTPLKLEPVSKQQLEAGAEMLQAAIDHWSALGSISITSFRESFLQRPGRLTHFKEGWILDLEQAPYDMLMDRLPWQMNYIQLPWMKSCIRMNI